MELARRLYADRPVDLAAVLSDRTMLDAMRSQLEPLVHPDFEAVFEDRGMPMGAASIEKTATDERNPTVYGFDGLVSTWREWLSAWDTWVVTPNRFVEVDQERVLVLMDVRALSKTHQVEMPVEGANLLTIRDGKLSRLELFLDQSEAFKAAGLSE